MNTISNFLHISIKKNNFLKMYFVVTVLWCLFVIPLKVTVDGHLYMSSARALFTDKMVSNYYFIREPFFPFMLKIIKFFFGNNDLGVIAVQASLLSGSLVIVAFIVLDTLKIKKINIFLSILFIVFSLNPFFLMFSGLILQQSLFTFSLTLLSLCIHLGFVAKQKVHQLYIFIFLILIQITNILIAKQFFVMNLVTMIVLIYVFYYKNSQLLPNPTKEPKSRYFLLLLVSILFQFAIYSVWDNFKDSTTKAGGTSDSFFSDYRYLPPSPVNGLTTYLDNFLALGHVGTSNEFQFSELTIYLEFMFHPNYRCGAYDSFEMLPYTDDSNKYLNLNCRSFHLQQFYVKFFPLFEFFYVAGYLFAITTYMLIPIIRSVRRLFLVFLPYIVFLTLYTYLIAGIDRYGVSVYPFTVGMILLSVLSLLKKLAILK